MARPIWRYPRRSESSRSGWARLSRQRCTMATAVCAAPAGGGGWSGGKRSASRIRASQPIATSSASLGKAVRMRLLRATTSSSPLARRSPGVWRSSSSQERATCLSVVARGSKGERRARATTGSPSPRAEAAAASASSRACSRMGAHVYLASALGTRAGDVSRMGPHARSS